MNITADNLLDEISQVFIKKLDTQKLDPRFLQKLFEELFKKVLFANKNIKLQQAVDTTAQPESPDTWASKIKNTFYNLTQDKDYEAKYRQFLKRAFDPSKINSLIPAISLNSNIINESSNEPSQDPTEQKREQPLIVKELKTDSLITKEHIIETVKDPTPILKSSKTTDNEPSIPYQTKYETKPLESLPVIKELKTESVITKDLNVNIQKDEPKPVSTPELEKTNTDKSFIPQPPIIKELKTESVITKDLNVKIQNDQTKPDLDAPKQDIVSKKEPATEIKEIKVKLDKELIDTNNNVNTSAPVKEQPTIIKELKTDTIVTNDFKSETNREQLQPQIVKDTTIEINKQQPLFVKELKTDTVNTKEVKSETVKEQPQIMREIKSDSGINSQIATNVAPVQQDYEEGRANKIKDIPKIHLDDITSTGQNALTNVLEPILKNIFQEGYDKKSKDKKQKNENDGGGLATTLAMMAASKLLLTGLGKMLGPVLSTLGTGLAKIAGPIAAVVGGNWIGGKIGEMIGSNETISKFLYGSETAGKEAYEKYGTGVPGLVNATGDLIKQGAENREQQKEHKRMSEERVAQSKESMVGKRKYNAEEEARRVKVVEDLKKQEEDLKKQYEELKSQALGGWNPFHDDQKETDTRMRLEGIQEVLTIQQNKLEQFRKLKSENNAEPKPPVAMKDGGIVTKPTKALIGEAGPEAVIPLTNNNTYNQTQNKIYSSSSDDVTPLTKLFDPQQFSLNNSSLNTIAANTSDTNNSLKLLSEAMFKLVTVFDKKISQSGNTTIINGTNKSTPPAPASAIAGSNVDPIRRVRMQFA